MSGFPSTATYASLVDEIILYLQGFATSPDQMTVLSADATATDTTFKVEDAKVVGRGVAEVGNELIYVNSFDNQANTFTTNTAWRGYMGTLAEAHAKGEVVRFAPSYPRSVVKRQINSLIASLYPDIFAVKSLEFSPPSNSPHYELPAEAAHVVDVRYKYSDAFGWNRVTAWGVEHSAPSEFASGVVLDLYGLVPPGVALQVLYAAPAAPLVNDADGFVATTGLSEGAREVVMYGVVYQLARAMDLARVPTQSTESDELSNVKPLGSATQLASAFGKQYEQALERERRILKSKYPTRLHKVR